MKLSTILVLVTVAGCAMGQPFAPAYIEGLVNDAIQDHTVVMSLRAGPQIQQMGDALAPMALRSLEKHGTISDRGIRNVLGFVHTAFSLPAEIKIPADKSPHKTLILLDKLETFAVAPTTRDEVANMRAYVRNAEKTETK